MLIINLDFILTEESDEYDSINESYRVEDVIKIQTDILRFCSNAIQRFKEQVNLFDKIKIIFVKKIGGVLGRYRSGTWSSVPIVMLSVKELLNGAKKYKVPLWVTVETTIFFVLGVAICDMERELGYDCLDCDNETKWAEDLAYDLHYYDPIPDDLKELIAKVNCG